MAGPARRLEPKPPRLTGAEARAIREGLLPDGVKEAPVQGIRKEWRGIARRARKQGWAIFFNGAGKLEWRGPEGQRTATAATPVANGRTSKNYLQQLRRAGVPGA